MKQTAVEFLLSHIWTTDWVNYTREEKMNVINQAKAMFEQQIKDAYDMGNRKGYDEHILSAMYDLDEQYYNETFKSK